MKRLVALFSVFLLLAACNGATVTGSYDLTFDTQDAAKQQSLTLAALRVLQRRIEAMQVRLKESSIRQEEGKFSIDVTVDDPATIALLSEQLARPFQLLIMVEAPEEEADATVEGHGGFRATGISQTDIDWVETAEDDEGKGVVHFVLTEEGQAKLDTLMIEEEGQSIGIFVRGVLISILPAAQTGSQGITIRGIPDLAMAETFADDVNVGTHSTFTPSHSLPSLP